MIIIALPAYNEEIALPPLLDSIAQVRQTMLPELSTRSATSCEP